MTGLQRVALSVFFRLYAVAYKVFFHHSVGLIIKGGLDFFISLLY